MNVFSVHVEDILTGTAFSRKVRPTGSDTLFHVSFTCFELSRVSGFLL